MMEDQRIAMGVSYNGAGYHGWQKQAHTDNTVQQHVEQALSQVANHPVELMCAGRTDAGVHGTGQVVHFDSPSQRSHYAWQMGVNSNLPRNIRIHWVMPVTQDFHARFSATHRRYHYVIEDHSVGNAIFHGQVTTVRYALDVAAMHAAAQRLVGEHDFTTFRAAQCQSKTPYRHVEHVSVTRHGRFIVVDVQANAFLYHMVRNMVGALLVVGQGKQPTDWLAALLRLKNRCQAPATAPADGLYLVAVGYDNVHHLPEHGNDLPFIHF